MEEAQTAAARSVNAAVKRKRGFAVVDLIVDLMEANPIISEREKFCLMGQEGARWQDAEMAASY